MIHPKSRTTLALTLGLSLVCITASPLAVADGAARHRPEGGNSHTAYAPVIQVRPVYRRVQVREPHRECWREPGHGDHHAGHPYGTAGNRYTSSYGRQDGAGLAGAVVGGVIGNQIGRHFGGQESRAVSTIAGAVIGSVIASEQVAGARHGSSGHGPRPPRPQGVERCREVVHTHHEQQIDFYRVRYRYQGHVYVTRTDRHPGRFIAIDVSIRPRPDLGGPHSHRRR